MTICFSLVVRKIPREYSCPTLRHWDSIGSVDLEDPEARSGILRLAPGSQTACYLPWLKVSVSLRHALTFPWGPEAWREVRQHIPWLWPRRTASARPGGSTDSGLW